MSPQPTVFYLSASQRVAPEATVAALRSALPGVRVEAVDDPDRPLDEIEDGCPAALVYKGGLDDERGIEIACAIEERDPEIPVVLYVEDPTPDLIDAAAGLTNTTVVKRAGDASDRIVAEAVTERLEPGGSDSVTSFDPNFEALVTTAPVGIVTIGADSLIRFANDSLAATFGYDADDLVGESLTTLMSDAIADRHLDAFARYLETGERTLDWEYVELTGEHADGHGIPIGVSFAEFTRDGERYFTGMIRDISERKRRTRELERYGAVMETVSDGIYALDGENRFVAVNDAYTELTGYSREELLGEPASTVTGEAIARELESVQSSLEEGTETVTMETDLETESGDTVPIEARISAFRLGEGEIGRVGVVRDVSARVRLEAELRQERNLNERILETAPVGIAVVDESGEVIYLNDRVEEITGVSRERLERGDVEFEFTDASGTELSEGELPFTQVMEGGESVYDRELGITPPGGEHDWLSVNGTRMRTGEDEQVLGVFTLEDITASKRRTERLRALNETARRLTEAETATDVCEMTVETASEVLDHPYTYVMLYDEREGDLEVAAQSDGVDALVERPLLGEMRTSPVWEAFVRDEQRVVTDVEEGDVECAAIFPLGDHGVLVSVSPDAGTWTESDLQLTALLSATAQSSLDRAGRETELREQRDTLERKNERLERLGRINRAIRDITQVLIQADSHEEIEELVCEKLVTIDPYAFAWIGHHDRSTGEVTPTAAAGEGDDLVEAVTTTTDDSKTGRGPAGRVVETGRPQVQNDILQADALDPWREPALSRGFRASISIPISHRDTLYGVLTLYADRPLAFDEMEATVLEELGRTIGYAMSAIERKEALMSDRSVELRFEVPALQTPLLGFLDGTQGEYVLENTVQRLDGYLHLFFRAYGVDPETVREDAAASPDVERFTLISQNEDECLCECTLSDSSFVSSAIERGVVFEKITVEDGSAELTVRLPRSVDVRGFVGDVQAALGEVELVARRESDRPVKTLGEFEDEVRNSLTERQEEVINTAYLSGYFEWPRESTGQEVAELLGVTQPTVNRHIRAGERTLFGVLFDE